MPFLLPNQQRQSTEGLTSAREQVVILNVLSAKLEKNEAICV